MSSSSHPYKSRLFNFFNRHSLRLREQLGNTARHLKVAAEWGVQILIYPLYLLVQTGRLTGQQLGKTLERAALPPADSAVRETSACKAEASSDFVKSDRPIERTLAAVEPWLTDLATPPSKRVPGWEQLQQMMGRSLSPSLQLQIITEQNADLKAKKCLVCGLASLLDSRRLVLVSADNQALDILTLVQQQKLQQRIRLETANYWYERRQASATTLAPISHFSENPQNVLLPLRWFWGLMRWIQSGSIATQINLFGESALVRVQPSVSSPSLTNFPVSAEESRIWPEIEQRLRQLPTNVRETVQVAIAQFTPQSRFLAEIAQTPPVKALVKPARAWGQQLQERVKQALAPTSDEQFSLQAVIEAAIDYFFGGASSPVKLQPPTFTKSEEADDPWLSWDDLFADIAPDALPSSSPVASLAASPMPEMLPHVLNQSLQPQLKSLKTPQVLTLSDSVTQTLPKEQSTRVTLATSQVASLYRTQASDTLGEISTDWIETQAQSVGYVKHPLVKILEWLDGAIVWLEDRLVKLWKWLK